MAAILANPVAWTLDGILTAVKVEGILSTKCLGPFAEVGCHAGNRTLFEPEVPSREVVRYSVPERCFYTPRAPSEKLGAGSILQAVSPGPFRHISAIPQA